jgi:hypothetical protein
LSSQSQCTLCDAGKYNTAIGQSSNTCSHCADGKWSSQGRGSACVDDCEAGYYCTGGVKTACQLGWYSIGGQSQCSQCEQDSYQDQTQQSAWPIYAVSKTAGTESTALTPGNWRLRLYATYTS